MKPAALFLLLLFCLSPAVSQGQSEASVPREDDVRTAADVPPELPVLWDELWGLRELVLSLKAVEVEQRQVLRSMESRLRDGEVEAEQQRRSLDRLEETAVQQREELKIAEVKTGADRKLLMELNSDLRRKVEELEEQSKARAVEFSVEMSTLRFRLNTSESSLDDLRKKNSALAAELPFLQTRLRASESTVEQLRRKNAVLAVRLCHAESLMEELMKQTSAFPASNTSSDSEASELEIRLNVRLEELNTNTHALQSRLNSLEEKLNTSAESHLPSFIQDQLSEISSRLNSSQLHLDELKRNSAGHTVQLWSVERRVEELKTGNAAQSADVSALTDRISVGERRLDELQTQTTVQADTVKQLQVRMNSVASQTHGTDQSFKLMKLQRKLNTTESLLDRMNAELEVRLSVSEEQLEDLKIANTVQSVQLSLMESRLADSHNNTTALEVRLRSTETQLEQLENHTAALKVRLSVSEEQLEDLKTENTVQSVHLSLMESGLADSHNNTTALEVRLRSTETQLENHTAALKVRLSVSEEQLEDLKIANTVQLSLMESRLADSHSNTTALEVRLRSTETQLEQLENHTAVYEAELSAVTLRLNITEEQVDELRTQNTDRLTAAERETEVLQVRLRVGEATVSQLKTENEAQSALLTEITSRLEAAENQNSVLSDAVTAIQNQSDAHSGDLSALRTETKVLEKQLSDADSLMMKLQTESSVQSVQLSLMESRLTDSHNSTTALEVRLRSTETQLEQLENHTAALKVRLSVSEEQLEDLKIANTELEVRLSVGEKQLEDLKIENSVLNFRLNETDDRLQQLTNTNSDELKVAFSAGLTDSGSVGPFDEETTLIFSKTITNIGQAYNQTAGVFTAPVRGLYFFSFTAADYLKGYMGLYLYRNNQPIIFNLDLNDHGGYASTSNGVALQLEEGDGVRLGLPASYRLYDDSRNFSVFSGFLLFPL
ncbi:myosin-2 heavy chain-like [Siniperca chuatsi]|uniref:myosin-2 heavy chain-like n=1 Tax=Siniperca chuatsi TaxID=119488 RepID=UPI001CE17C48|nr:myosin-2 heavy chain-like [Siniperca chuatsi]